MLTKQKHRASALTGVEMERSRQKMGERDAGSRVVSGRRTCQKTLEREWSVEWEVTEGEWSREWMSQK